MATYTYETNDQPVVHISDIGGDVSVSGWDNQQIRVDGDDENVRSSIKQQENTFKIGDVDDDMVLYVPRDAQIRLGDVGGSITVTDVATAQLNDVGCDVTLRNIVGAVHAGDIGGDIAIDGAAAAQVADVGGDATLRNIRGPVALNDIGGDVILQNVAGAVAVHDIGGDLVTDGTATVGAVGSVGEDLTELGHELRNMGREIAAAFGPRVWAGKRGRKGKWGASVGLNPEQTEQIRQQVRASINKDEIRQQVRQAARAGLAQARASVEQALGEVRVTPPTPPAPPTPPTAPTPTTASTAPPTSAAPAGDTTPSPTTPPSEPASAEPITGVTAPLPPAQGSTTPDRDAERLAILRMVREGTVTPEEAEELLAALDR